METGYQYMSYKMHGSVVAILGSLLRFELVKWLCTNIPQSVVELCL